MTASSRNIRTVSSEKSYRFFRASGRLKRHMHAVEVVSAVLLVAVGVLLLTDRLTVLAQWFSRMFPGLAQIG